MSNTIQPLAGERQSGETSRALQACNDFLRMGAGRSLVGLLQEYCENTENYAPTRSKGTLEQWSKRYGWFDRAELYDVRIEAEKNARAQEIMNSGLALAHERTQKLKELAGFLEDQVFEQGEGGEYHNVWVPDVKVVGHGDNAEAVDIERFNAALLREYRETMADIAAETGGRVKRQEITGKDGESLTPKVYVTISPDDWDAEEREGAE